MDKKRSNSTKSLIKDKNTPISEVYPVLDASLAMDYLENAADLEDL